MAKFFGLNPQSSTLKVTEEFENRVNIRRNNQRLLAKVYTDITDDQWAVAVAYNLSLNPGLWGKENALEIKYTYQPDTEPVVKRIETEIENEKTFPVMRFDKPDTFIIWALNKERDLIKNAT
jgi:hypothetical protein